MAQPRKAGTNVDPVDDAARDYLRTTSKEIRLCRRLRHKWDSVGLKPGTWHHMRVYIETIRCDRCGTERHDALHPRSMEVLKRGYDYCDGYQNTGGGTVALLDVRKFDVQLPTRRNGTPAPRRRK